MNNIVKVKAIKKFILEIKKNHTLNIGYVYLKEDDLFDIWHDSKELQFHDKEFLKFVGLQLQNLLYSKGIYNISFGYDYVKAKILTKNKI